MIFSNEVIRRQAERARLEADIKAFLEAGGAIKAAPSTVRHFDERITERNRPKWNQRPESGRF